MSYSQKIKNLLHNMKKINNLSKNAFINENISRNLILSKNNTPLIIEEKDINTVKRLPLKNYKNKYLTSIENRKNNEIVEYISSYEDKNYNQNKQYNNNFIIETSYEKDKSKPNRKSLIIDNSNKSYFSLINKSSNYLNCSEYNITDEKGLLFNKLNYIKDENKNKYNNIYFSFHKNRNLNSSGDEVHNNVRKLENKNAINLSKKTNNKKKLSSYILKDTNNTIKLYMNNASPRNFSTLYNTKKFSHNTNLVLNNENYTTNLNNNNKKIKTTSRIVKRKAYRSLSNLFNEQKNLNIQTDLDNNSKYFKNDFLMDKSYNIAYDHGEKRNRFKKNYNSSNNIKERDNHSEGKIILFLDENSSKRKSKKTKNIQFYIILIQSIWRGYILRKLIKITRELFLVFFPFINKIKILFIKYKKNYFSFFKNKIKNFFLLKNSGDKISIVNNRIKKNRILYNKNSINIRSHKFLKNINTAPLINEESILRKNAKINNNNKPQIETKMNDINKLKINNIFYHKKRLSSSKTGTNIKYIPNSNNLKNDDKNERLIKRNSCKKFFNVSPEYKNIQLNINNSLKNSIYENRNNYSSSISIFFQTQFPQSKLTPLKNLVYINKNKKPKNSIKYEMFEKIKIKIFNNFYLILCKCITKAILRFYWNKLFLNLQKIKSIISLNIKKKHILKLIITNKNNNIKKLYFRKYRENILIEKIKTKLFYLTDYSRSQFSLFNSKYLNQKSKNRMQILLNIYEKYKINNQLKYTFLSWKGNNHYKFNNTDSPFFSSRCKIIKPNLKKMSNYNIYDINNINRKEHKLLVYKKNNYIKINGRSPIKKNHTENHLYTYNNSPNNQIKSTKYNKKKISNNNIKIGSLYTNLKISNINNKTKTYNNNIKISNINNNQNFFNCNRNRFTFLNKIRNIIEKINQKIILVKFLNLWKQKERIKNIAIRDRIFYNKKKYFKYFLLYLKYNLNDDNIIINNKLKIGKSLFIWYRNSIFNSNRKNFFFIQ